MERRDLLVEDPESRANMGLAIILGVGLSMGLFSVAHIVETDVSPEAWVYVLTPLVFNAGLLVSAGLLWRRDDVRTNLLRIGGWVFVGMVVFGLLVTWTIIHEFIRGGSFAHSSFVTVNNMSVGALIGLVLGWLEARNREYEVELESERAELQRRVEQLDDFVSVVSHDLRNPLNVATLNLQTAQAECESDALEDVSSSLDRMEIIIEDVLTMAREGQTVEETEEVSLRQIAERCWANVQTDRATITVEDELLFRADPSPLHHVFENLYRNADEHAGADVTIRVGALADGFYVADDGPGLEGTDVFDDADDGPGLGLRIVRQMVGAHGWEVRAVESSDGGARFEITGVDVVARPEMSSP